MPRPKTKEELQKLGKENYDKLMSFIELFSAEELEKEFPKGTMNRNIRDVLAHLHHWHLMMLEWYNIGMKGVKPAMPAKGYTWKTIPKLNKEIRKMYADIELSHIKKKLTVSHNKVMELVDKHTNEELFEKKRYKWTGTTSLGAYLISATSSHYDWAYKLIKKCKK